MHVLVGCEFSGTVREAFRRKGHDAWSCDLLPAEDGSKHHIQDDVRRHLCDGWDVAILFPPCTDLCVSGARWFAEKKDSQENSLDFVARLMLAPITHIAWNPVDFVIFASNYYTMQTAFTGPQYAGYGVVQTPKIPHITSVISPLVPRGIAYAVDQNSVFCGEGPVITETEHVASRLSDVGYMHDFVQFVIPNPDRFGLKIEIGGVANADKGTEISTISQARKLATPKVKLARKN